MKSQMETGRLISYTHLCPVFGKYFTILQEILNKMEGCSEGE